MTANKIASGSLRKVTYATLLTRGVETIRTETEEGHITAMANSNTTTVSADRTYNVGNYESVRIHIGYTQVVESGQSAVKVSRKIADILPKEIERTFKVFCKEHGLKRAVKAAEK